MKRFLQTMILSFLAAASCNAQENIDGFVARIYKNASSQTMPYRLFIPKEYDAHKKYPLVLWLHGAGGAGADNILQISGDQFPGTRIWTKPENQTKYPSFVLVPQSRGVWVQGNDLGARLSMVLNILDALRTEFSIDPRRLYVTGQSNGGFGTWELVTQKPGLFAAAIPLCSPVDPNRAAVVARLPIWAFTGAKDDSIVVTSSREMIAGIRKAGGNPRYTEYKGVGHDVWLRAFQEPGLVDWLFAQHR
jgi:predicted peptidase